MLPGLFRCNLIGGWGPYHHCLMVQPSQVRTLRSPGAPDHFTSLTLGRDGKKSTSCGQSESRTILERWYRTSRANHDQPAPFLPKVLSKAATIVVGIERTCLPSLSLNAFLSASPSFILPTSTPFQHLMPTLQRQPPTFNFNAT